MARKPHERIHGRWLLLEDRRPGTFDVIADNAATDYLVMVHRRPAAFRQPNCMTAHATRDIQRAPWRSAGKELIISGHEKWVRLQ